jgi:hypothetical protein
MFKTSMAPSRFAVVVFVACMCALALVPYRVKDVKAVVPILPRQVTGCVVIVHLGEGEWVEKIPMQHTAQLVDNVEQLRLFNPLLTVYIVVSPSLKLPATEAARLAAAKAELVTTDTLELSAPHLFWQQHSALAKKPERNFFWRYASERFFYLSDLAVQKENLTNIIHIVSERSSLPKYILAPLLQFLYVSPARMHLLDPVDQC